MFKRKVVLTTTSVATQILTSGAIKHNLKKIKPDWFESKECETQKEFALDYLKVIGLSVGVVLVSAIVSGVITNAVDNAIFPDITGPY